MCQRANVARYSTNVRAVDVVSTGPLLVYRSALIRAVKISQFLLSCRRMFNWGKEEKRKEKGEEEWPEVAKFPGNTVHYLDALCRKYTDVKDNGINNFAAFHIGKRTVLPATKKRNDHETTGKMYRNGCVLPSREVTFSMPYSKLFFSSSLFLQARWLINFILFNGSVEKSSYTFTQRFKLNKSIKQ